MINQTYKISLVFLLLSSFLFQESAFAQVKTNLSILHDLMVCTVITTLDSVLSKQADLQIVLNEKSEAGYWWLENLRESLLNRNFRLYEADSNKNKGNVKLVLNRIHLIIRYYPEGKDLLFRTKKYRREIMTVFSYFLKDRNDAVILSRQKNLFYNDKISRSEIKKVENQIYSFSVGTKMESKFVKVLIEPFVVTVTTAVVVYLFYTLRSGS